MIRLDCEWRTVAFPIVLVLLVVSTGRTEPIAHVVSHEQIQPESALDETAEAWIVSTRCVPASCPTDIGPERFSYQVLGSACAEWNPTDAETFFGSAVAAEPVIVFIHGNRTDSREAVREGWPVYKRLLSESGGQPFRFVIWSWPAERIRWWTSKGRFDQGGTERYAKLLPGCLARSLADSNAGSPNRIQFRCPRDWRGASP